MPRTKVSQQQERTSIRCSFLTMAQPAAVHPPPSSSSSSSRHEDLQPQSVEEAGALLGAAITRYGTSTATTTPIGAQQQQRMVSPKGLHSGFDLFPQVPSSQLLHSLYSLRSLLRSVPADETPLVAAPSLLAGVLMKLLAMSSTLAVAHPPPSTTASSSNNSNHHNNTGNSSSSDSTRQRVDIPPMLSTPVSTCCPCVFWKLESFL